MKVCKVLNPELHKYVLRLNKKALEYRVAEENLNKIFLGYQVEDLFYVLEEYYAKFNQENNTWFMYYDQECKKSYVPTPWNPEEKSNHWSNYNTSGGWQAKRNGGWNPE